MTALVLAAGRSTRIRAIAGDLPKPLLPVAGRPIIDHTLRWLAASGVRDAWINLHYEADQIRRFVGSGERYGLDVRYSEEEPILGTAGAVKKLRGEWTDTFLVVYGDNLVRFTLSALLERHRRLGTIATIALFDPATHPFTGIAGGRVALADGLIQTFTEGPPDSEGGLVNAGVYALEPAIDRFIPDGQLCDFGRDVFPRLLGEGVPLGGHVIDGYCLGLDAPGPLSRGLELIRAGEVRIG